MDQSTKPSSICLQDFDCIGLDIDHTLCKYKLDNFFPLSYEYSARILVEEKGYDESLLQPFEMHKDLCIKGMVFDVLNGDFLKLSDEGIILRASHGTRVLTDDEINDKYGKERRWNHFTLLESSLEQTEMYGYTENYYDLPFMVLLARMIDLQEEKHGGSSSVDPKIFKDVVEGYVQGFIYQEGKETILSACEKEPEKYLERCSQHLKTWLRSLQDHCKMVFLLSSANPIFADHVMKYILGDDWQSYFNICLLQARKPGFFKVQESNNSRRPFYTVVDGRSQGEIATDLEDGQCYLQGNVQSFNDHLKKFTGKEQPKVLYFGDSIRSDIHPSNVFGGWQSVLVLEEMEVEDLLPNQTCTLADMGQQVDGQYSRSGPSLLEREFLVSKQWGSFFGDHLPKKMTCNDNTNDDDDISNEDQPPVAVNTLWTRLMKIYADIAIPKLDYMADFPTNFKFETFSNSDWRKGYHPGMPKHVTY